MQDLNNLTRLKWWPAPQDYNEAVQNLRQNTFQRHLTEGQVELDSLDLPKPVTGAFASVYRVKMSETDVALRCFLRDTLDQERRYQLISEFVRKDDLASTVNFEFIRQGIRVNGSWFPVLEMDWVDGLTLDAYVRQNIHQPDKLRELVDNFVSMCADLRRAGIAHGDLQHGNIMVSRGELRLVDYDGMFVPQMQGMQSEELGHPSYQHPGRDMTHFGPDLDNFSAWVIFVSLQSLALDPSLYETLSVGDDCLLLRRTDLQQPLHSPAFWLLEEHANDEIAWMAKFLRWQLGRPLHEVPPLCAATCELPQLPPLVRQSAVIEVAPAPPVKMKKSPNRTVKMPSSASFLQRTIAATAHAGNVPQLPGSIEDELLTGVPRVTVRNQNTQRYNPMHWQLAMLVNPFVWMTILAIFGWPEMHIARASGDMIAFFVFCLLLFEIPIWFAPLRHRGLVRSGTAAIATVKDFQQYHTKGGPQHSVVYIFSTPRGEIEGRDYIEESQYRQMKWGQELTVLYDPTNPKNCTLYQFSHYKALPKAD